MSFVKRNYIDGEIVITAENLNDIQDAIIQIVPDDVKQALLQIASKVAYIDEDGQDYYDALESALYPDASLVSISAVYTQSGTVYDTDSLDSLKADLVVTAHFDDSSTEVVTAYTLSGTLEVGTSTITVSYGGKTTTFSVNVTLNREALFGQFLNGYAVAKTASPSTYPDYGNYAYRTSTSARATTVAPCTNNNYVFTVTDSSKYSINIVDVSSDTQLPLSQSGSVDHIAYRCGNKTVGWNTTDSVSTSFAWIVLKKNDGTAFTDAELANGAEAVFTFSQS